MARHSTPEHATAAREGRFPRCRPNSIRPLIAPPISAELASSRRHRQLDQPQMARHRMEIAVVVEQWPAVLDAPPADQQLDCLANGDPAPAQGTEISGRRGGNRAAGHWHNFEAGRRASTSRAVRSWSRPCSTSQSIRSATMIRPRNAEVACSTHAAGSKFVRLHSAPVAQSDGEHSQGKQAVFHVKEMVFFKSHARIATRVFVLFLEGVQFFVCGEGGTRCCGEWRCCRSWRS